MRRVRFVGIKFILFGIVLAGVIGLVTTGLWNTLMPAIFGLPMISFWQGLGLLVLSRVLFGRMGGGWGSRMRKAKFARGWGNLTPEERERFRSAMGSCGGRRFAEGSTAEKV